MKDSTNTAAVEVSAGPSSPPREKRHPFTLRRWIESLLLVVGAVLLALCAVAWVHRIVLSRAAVKQFEASKQKETDKAADTAEPHETPLPDFASWSKRRIASYENSLVHQFATPLGILRVPRLNMEAPVLEGTDDLILNRGVGRIQGTAALWNEGNVGIAGHRDSFFRGLKDIKVGDRVEVEGREQTDTYVVDEITVVDPNNVGVLQPRSGPSLTLVTCYPFYFIGSAPKRYIVHASRTNSARKKQNTTEQGSLTLANNK